MAGAHFKRAGRARLLGLAAAVGTAAAWALAAMVVVGSVLLNLGPRLGWYRSATVLSGSMSPHIPMGSVVIDEPHPAAATRPGDVITYQIPIGDHQVVTHRVVAVLVPGPQPVVQTKGDANPIVDPWRAHLVSAQVWKVHAVIPYVGFAMVWLRQPGVRLVFALGLPIALAAMALRSIWRSRALLRTPHLA